MNTPAYSIHTERLLIRCFQPADAPLLKEAIDASLDHLRPWMVWAEKEPEELDAKIARVRRFRAEFDLDKSYNYGIFTPESSRMLGGTGLHRRIGEGGLEIGYWLRAEETCKGYMTESASALVRVAFEVALAERVEIHCDARNERSAAIPRRLGFRNEAVLRENKRDETGNRLGHMIWVLFRDEYDASPLARFPLAAFDALDRKIL